MLLATKRSRRNFDDLQKTRGNTLMGSFIAGNDRSDNNKLRQEDEQGRVSTDAPATIASEESLKPRTYDLEHQLSEKEQNTKEQTTQRRKRRRKLRIYLP
jgi:hypothetical protein